MKIIFNKNKSLININKFFQTKIGIIINNSEYFYCENYMCCYQFFNKINYKYLKCFSSTLNSYYKIEKSQIIKLRDINKIYISYNTFYSYFIYNKYFKYVNIKAYYLTEISLYIINNPSSAKKFNCRDYYKIHSFI